MRTFALSAVAATPHVALTRMSGSGATVAGFYPTVEAARAAAVALADHHPTAWVQSTRLAARP